MLIWGVDKKLKITIQIILLLLVLSSPFISWRQKMQKEERDRIILQEKIAKQESEQKIYLLGKFDPSQREDFALVPPEYNGAGENIYLRKETLAAFLDMAKAAKKDGLDLIIGSATRNFEDQKNLWNDKWNGVILVDGENLSESAPDSLERFKKNLKYTAVPGVSRHHWGTEIDINITVPYYFLSENGKIIYEWMVKNASSFGFCQTYNAKDANRPTGYSEEKWHWSYIPLSKNFTNEYVRLIKNEDIKGFLGDENVPKENLINDYVLGINPQCL